MDNKEREREAALKSINDLKKDINLVQFACHKYGYIPDWLHPDRKRGDTVKSSVNSIKLINTKNQMDSIIVAKNATTGDYVYKSLVNSDDKGSILDMVKYRTDEFSIPKFRKICKNYVQGLEKGFYNDLGFDTRKVLSGAGSIDKPNVELFANYLQPLTNSDYLIKRGIDEDLQKKHFGVAYNHTDDKGALSVVIPFYTVKEIADNESKKHLAIHTYQKYSDDSEIKKKFINGSKSNSVWINAGAFDNSKKITSLVVSESPLDSVSFAALHPNKCGDNPILSAFGGEMGFGVPGTYNNILTISKCDNLILANDNDCKGQQYNAKILAELPVQNLVDEDFLEKNKALLDTKIELGVSEYKGYMEWRFSHNKFEDNDKIEGSSLRDVMPLFVDVKDYYLQENKDLKGVLDEKDVFKLECKFGGGNFSTIQLEFKNSKDNWERINESLLCLKYGFSEKLSIEKAIENDFNDDLKKEKGLLNNKSEERTETKGVKI